ncbi:MAG: hypothetical protein ACMUIU_03885 [bacterium]
MSKKFFLIFFVICLWIVLPFFVVSAQIGVEVLIYTGKISVTSNNEISTIYTMPQEVKDLPANTIIECIDGVAIFKIGEVQVVLETGDKLQLLSMEDKEKVNMICISGEIEAMWGEEFFKLTQEQILGLSSEGKPLIDQAEGIVFPESGARSKQTPSAITPPDPDEAIYTSSHL